MSCAAACIRQLAKDNGINISEEAVRILARTDGFGDGTQLHRIESAMKEVFVGKNIQAGSAVLDDLSNIEIIKILSQNEKPWIAILKPSGKMPHVIIVDKVIKDNVYIRDPWGKNYGFGEEFGVEAIIKIEDFEYFWKGSRNYYARLKN